MNLSLIKERLQTIINGIPPVRTTMFGYLSYVLLGWFVLCLPFSQRNPQANTSTLDHLFIATSAVSTTGLATVSPGETYSFLGQLFILLMIQVGGIGYMTLGSFIVLTRTNHLTVLRSNIAKTTFSLPQDIPIRTFIKQVIFFTLAVETIGSLALWFAFHQAGVSNALWQAIFHSISAFCTAGFSLFSNGMEPFRDNFWINFIICALSYAGAIGFIVWTDFVLVVLGKREHMTLTSKIILKTTFWLTILGTGAFLVLEPSIAQFDAHQRVMISVFQTMTAITTVGFNTHPISSLSYALLIFVSLLMLIGASPSGTGGGLKSTTFTIFIGLIRSAFQRKEHVMFQGKRIPEARIRAATSAVATYLSVTFLAIFALSIFETHIRIEDLFFEVISAVGTVGISRGATGELSPMGKCVLTVVMFAGRLGPLALGIALFMSQPITEDADDTVEDLAT